MNSITCSIGGLTADELTDLWRAVGWGEVNGIQAETGVKNSVNAVAKDDGRTIGCARLVTDGGYQVLLADVMVHPDYQRRGIGTALVKKLLEYLEQKRLPGQWYFISLMSNKGKENFYKQLGFIERPNDDSAGMGAGMIMYIGRE
ncbi:MAG: GNAT family N-acetyltransferase [Synergistaceae bacterium]|jgi:predicted N-acetyltransferase YhbS|nr:GNAT family N-acetyltransferase [Synergistaceae bacterium]